jgi:hypothetical protein
MNAFIIQNGENEMLISGEKPASRVMRKRLSPVNQKAEKANLDDFELFKCNSCFCYSHCGELYQFPIAKSVAYVVTNADTY